MRRFADCAAAGCAFYAELALALAGEFRPVDASAVEDALHEIDSRLALDERRDPQAQLACVAAAVTARIGMPVRCPDDDGDFMLDSVLATGAGQPVMLAVVAAELGARRGLPLGIVTDGRRHLLAHRDPAAPLVADFAARRLRHPEELEAPLSWACAHEVACAVLQVLLDRALARADMRRAIRAAELQLALPFDQATPKRALGDLIALQASLN